MVPINAVDFQDSNENENILKPQMRLLENRRDVLNILPRHWAKVV